MPIQIGSKTRSSAGALSRVKTGYILIRESIGILRNNRTLAAFPIVAGLAGLGFILAIGAPTVGVTTFDNDASTIVAFAGAAGIYFGTAFIAAFFSAGLVDQTRTVLQGGDPSLKAGLRSAWRVKTPLVVWAVISATVGLIIDAISESDSVFAQILAAVLGVSWSLLTFFIIPVIVFENPSTTEMFRQSGQRFKETYGETIIGMFGATIAGLVVGIPFFLAGLAALEILGSLLVGIPLVIIGIALAQVVSFTVRGIVKTGLYFYAEEGQRPDEFNQIFDALDLSERSESDTDGPQNTGPQFGGVS